MYIVGLRLPSQGVYHKTEPIIDIGKAHTVALHVLELVESRVVALPNCQVVKRHMDLIEKHAGKSGDIDSLYGLRVE